MTVDTSYLSRLEGAVAFLRARWGNAPPVALVLGSGLGDFLEVIPGATSLPYQEIPHFPVSAVVGHAGRLVVASHQEKRFCALQGRVHFYEGYPPDEVAFAVRALGLWGAETFLITNAAGGINPVFQPGDLMLIRDHINLMGSNPLRGPNLEILGERFPDMSEAYSASLLGLARSCAAALSLELKEGVYVGLAGPSYETPAEIRACRVLGADAVGMSTVPEVIALNHMHKQVLGLSCITNMAAGILPRKLRHQEVLETTRRVKEKFRALILTILERL